MNIGPLHHQPVLVYLRQIALELKRANDLAEVRLELEYPDSPKFKRLKGGKGAKVSSFGVARVSDWNDEWEKRKQEKESG